MKRRMRVYEGEEDYWRVRGFLREVSLLNDRHDYSWSLLRWDYWMWHVNMNIFHLELVDAIFLWEVDDKIVAMLNPDRPGEAFFQIHPDLREAAPLSEMLDAAERNLSQTKEAGRTELIAWVNAEDHSTKKLFDERGYARSQYSAEHMRRRCLSGPIPDSVSPPGYTVRALGEEEELPARSWLSWKAFHPDEPDEKYEGWAWYENVQRIPLYRRDLDLVASGPGGELAAFCTVWFDDVTRTAVFEPVGTHPAHQKRGLGKAVMTEGLRRAQRLGATLATVSSYSPAAHALYESMGFTEFDLLEPWIRDW
ncbi:MAG TPA: GNAT family N-acetyltransferase [Anaerolineales bacterium]|nr:GNAT family N-acetyltransferase [Anaerolineales bacterium]